MSWQFILTVEADEDIQTAADSLENARTGWGIRFLDELQTLFARIENNPMLYAVLKRDVRAVRIPGSQFVAYYLIIDQRIEVIAVTHGARHESNWLRRR